MSIPSPGKVSDFLVQTSRAWSQYQVSLADLHEALNDQDFEKADQLRPVITAHMECYLDGIIDAHKAMQDDARAL